MNLAELEKIIEHKSTVMIFGANDIGLFLYKHFSKINDKRVYICDSSREKVGKLSGGGEEVLPIEEAVSAYKEAFYLIASYCYFDDMKQMLLKNGIPETEILMAVVDEALEARIEGNKKLKSKPLDKIQFEVKITEHCNLNCRSCSHFSCIAEPSFINIQEMENDFQRLGELFHGEAKRIYLTGGEPLLNKNIITCMKIARKCFPIGEISVFTNGILLSDCNDEFWEECKKDSISIIVTKYPINVDYNALKKQIMSKGVDFTFFGTSEDFKTMVNLGLDLEGRQNPQESFYLCYESNNCITLKHGRLYTCSRPAAIEKFNRFFDKHLEVSSDDYIDIYEAEDGQEILNRLSQPVPFCRYCNQKMDGKKPFRWGNTHKKIEEFLMLK